MSWIQKERHGKTAWRHQILDPCERAGDRLVGEKRKGWRISSGWMPVMSLPGMLRSVNKERLVLQGVRIRTPRYFFHGGPRMTQHSGNVLAYTVHLVIAGWKSSSCRARTSTEFLSEALSECVDIRNWGGGNLWVWRKGQLIPGQLPCCRRLSCRAAFCHACWFPSSVCHGDIVFLLSLLFSQDEYSEDLGDLF